MKKIALINFYFGDKKPEYIDFYLSSVSYNSTIDLFLFTNLNIENNYNNVHIIKIDFESFADIIISKISKELKERKINEKITITNAYKIADFRPTFGLCFQEYLKGYDFWGGCDLDIIFGDIRKFVTDNILDKYDKIFEHGHFFLIRNNRKCNYAFLEDFENCFKGVLKIRKNSFFEEVYEKPWLPHGGINSIFDSYHTLYKNRNIIMDISFKYKNLIDLKNSTESKQNIFEFNKGKLICYSLLDHKIISKEYFYAHFQKRQMNVFTSDVTRFLMTNQGFQQYQPITNSIFHQYTCNYNLITKKYIKFKYIDFFRRKFFKEFKWIE